MRADQARIYGLIICTLAFVFVVIWAFSTQFDFLFSESSLVHLFASFFFFDRFYLDFLVYLLVAIVLINGNVVLRIAGYIWLFLLTTCYVLQFLSVYIGGAYVSFLAVDNANHVSLLVNIQNMTAVVLIVGITVLTVYIVEYRCRTSVSTRQISKIFGAIFILTLVVHFHRAWIPDAVAKQIDDFYLDRNNRMEHQSPMESFYNVLFSDREGELRAFLPKDVVRAGSYEISLDPEQRFPLVENEIYGANLPFEEVNQPNSPPNVILFFAEGLSARTLNVYNDLFPGLTPNLVDFATESMVVHNYFNHTYATYRGLLGQLCSIFPDRGGLGGWHTHYQDIKRTEYLCLSHLLKGVGYQTMFLDTHRRDQGYIDEMMDGIGFDNVLNAEDMVTAHQLGEPLRKDALSDTQLMTALIEELKHIQRQKSSQPFFISLYNLETHAWQKIARDGTRYPGQDNYILDAIHNYDHGFGRFWKFFQQSSLAYNTIVIFTSDHAHYADRDFVELVGDDPGYLPYFVDRIPLIIYDPRRTLPREFNAQNATSIDFTPSMAHFLGLENQSNPFVGNSIFNPDRNINASIASADQEHYLINSQGVRMHKPGSGSSEELEFIGYLVNSLRQLERHNRIWPAK